jgi:segregation and condensation protein B
MDRAEQKRVIEAVLFLTEEPLKADRIAAVLATSLSEAEILMQELKDDLGVANRGLQIVETAGGFQMGTVPELAPYLERAFSEDVSSNLSTAALEALAIIAYKQPVTRIEIESIRGVRSEHVLENLLKRKLVKISGRKEGPGRPLLYGTTADFLKYFGLKELADLPPLDIEYETKAEEGAEARLDHQNSGELDQPVPGIAEEPETDGS